MSFQPLFRKFDEAIKLRRYKENKELNEKSKIILDRIRDKIAVPHTFQFFPQGSYVMGTGVKPLNGDYDIDIGVEFNVCCDDYPPVTVKGWVYDAVKEHTQDVAWRGPCITVGYKKGGQRTYHVDLAIMAKDRYGTGLRLARGKQNAAPKDQSWQPDDRRAFMQAVENRFPDERGEQFRRVIRYLKRWKDVHFPAEGRSAPTGLSLTLAAYWWFSPVEQDDLRATQNLVDKLRGSFSPVWDQATQRQIRRLSLRFPFPPADDLLERMSNEQQQQFYQRLEKLAGWLEDARRNSKVSPLQTAFGKDFPEK